MLFLLLPWLNMFLKGRDLPAWCTAQLWSSLRAGMLVTRPLGCEQPRGAGEEGIPSTCLCPNPTPPDEEMVFRVTPGHRRQQQWGSWRGLTVRAVLLCHERELEPRRRRREPWQSSPGQGEPLLSCWSIVQLLLLQGVGICTGVTLWIIKRQNMKL